MDKWVSLYETNILNKAHKEKDTGSVHLEVNLPFGAFT